MNFSDLNLDPNVLRAVEETGYKEPTPIQAEAIPHALAGRDVLGIAQTGTGKTASFTLPMISMLAKGRARARMPRSLILCPTRELAAQVSENFEIYGKYHKLTMALLIGGVSFGDQDRLIDRGVDVLIATPGRLLDHFERGKLMLSGVQLMVVDEADRMLDMGFIPDIERIFKLTPFTRQTLFFSATMPPEITRLTEQFLQNPVRVEVARASSAAETVEQRVCMLRPSRKDKTDIEKRDALRALIRNEGENFRNAIVFCNRKRDVSVLHTSLRKHGLNAGALHGDLDQSVRTRTLHEFRDDEIKILVASDVAARGLDIPNVSHIFNFDVPIHSEDYVHRIGRTGRAGRAGIAITLCLPHEQKHLDKIETLVGKAISRTDPPGSGAPVEAEAGAEAPHVRRRSTRAKTAKPETRTTPSDTAAAPQASKAEEPQVGNSHKSAKSPRKNGERSKRGGRNRQEESDNQIVGLGDHVPAFLLRPVLLPKAAPRRDAPTSAEDDGAGATA